MAQPSKKPTKKPTKKAAPKPATPYPGGGPKPPTR